MVYTVRSGAILSSDADFEALGRSVAGLHGIYSATEGAVTTSSGITVAVAATTSGTVVINGTPVVTAYAGGTIALTAAHATLNRRDIIYIGTSGTVGKIDGTAAATPALSNTFDPATQFMLAEVYVAFGATTIATADITDKRLRIGWGGTKGSDITAATTITVGQSNYYHVTGTTPITGIAARPDGYRVLLKFDAACPLTYNGTSFILSGDVDRTTVAGDVLEFVSEGSGNWRELRLNNGGRKTAGAGYFQIPTAPAVGTNVTQSASANTYGSVAELIASTSAAIYVVGVQVGIPSTYTPNVGAYIVVSLSTGAGAGTGIGEALFQPTHNPNAGGTSSATFSSIPPYIFPYPIPVATATRIAAKVASEHASANVFTVALVCINQTNLVSM